MRISRVLAVVFILALFLGACTNLALADQTRFTLKYSWPRLDVEGNQGSARWHYKWSTGLDASINMWSDRVGLLTSLELGQLKGGELEGEELKGGDRVFTYHADMRAYLANFIKRWSDSDHKALKVLKDINLAFIMGWRWQNYIWQEPHSTPFIGSPIYILRTYAPELGLSLDWRFYDQASLHFLARGFALGRAEVPLVAYKIGDVHGCDAKCELTFDWAKLLKLKKQSLELGVGCQYELLNAESLGEYKSFRPMITVSYGFAHSW